MSQYFCDSVTNISVWYVSLKPATLITCNDFELMACVQCQTSGIARLILTDLLIITWTSVILCTNSSVFFLTVMQGSCIQYVPSK